MKPASPPKPNSIGQNLLRSLGKGLPAVWLVITLLSIPPILHETNEAGDTAMMQLAHKLLSIDSLGAPGTHEYDPLSKQQAGYAEDDFSGVAVWTADGTVLLADKLGANIHFRPDAEGFVNQGHWWSRDSWRVLYLHDTADQRYVAVSFSWKERLEALFSAVVPLLLFWLLGVPLVLWMLVRSIRNGLQPLYQLSNELGKRDAGSLNTVSENVPAEVLPLVRSLNDLFQRVSVAIEREQRFTSDAAHELRSPLAALKVQTEVLALSQSSDEQAHHSMQIRQSIERAENLINQLLVLARLDPAAPRQDWPQADWNEISSQALQSVNLHAREKYIRLQRETPDAEALPLQGDALLLQLMLRNLLDNAVRYSPERGRVTLVLAADYIEVYDNGAGIAEAHLARLTERFYRPAGQNEQGSGLGLSIVEQIARLHGLKLIIGNRPEGGFSAKLVCATH